MEKSNLFDLNVDAEISGYLSETARWGRFLAIFGLISVGFMILFGLLMNFMPPLRSERSIFGEQVAESYNTDSAVTATIGMVFYVGFGILSIFPYVMLLKFSNRVKLALQSSDQAVFASAFANLKSLFKFVGVLTIITLVFVVLAIIILVIGSIFLVGAPA